MSKPRVGETAGEVRKRWKVADEVPDHAEIVSLTVSRLPVRSGFIRFGFFEWEASDGKT